jgi:hypothetical protein
MACSARCMTNEASGPQAAGTCACVCVFSFSFINLVTISFYNFFFFCFYNTTSISIYILFLKKNVFEFIVLQTRLFACFFNPPMMICNNIFTPYSIHVTNFFHEGF